MFAYQSTEMCLLKLISEHKTPASLVLLFPVASLLMGGAGEAQCDVCAQGKSELLAGRVPLPPMRADVMLTPQTVCQAPEEVLSSLF